MRLSCAHENSMSQALGAPLVLIEINLHDGKVACIPIFKVMSLLLLPFLSSEHCFQVFTH